jgi:hypothetical protein
MEGQGECLDAVPQQRLGEKRISFSVLPSGDSMILLRSLVRARMPTARTP